jgi:hypothetical protein
MPKRNLKVLKWMGTTPAVAVCTLCSREFKVTLAEAKNLVAAQDSLQRQFSAHACAPNAETTERSQPAKQ